MRGFIDLTAIELRRDLNGRWDIGAHGSLRHSWKSSTLDSAYGISVGYEMATNLWLSMGYSFAGFRDADFSGSEYRSEGPYLRMRFKFDQQTVKDLLDLD